MTGRTLRRLIEMSSNGPKRLLSLRFARDPLVSGRRLQTCQRHTRLLMHVFPLTTDHGI